MSYNPCRKRETDTRISHMSRNMKGRWPKQKASTALNLTSLNTQSFLFGSLTCDTKMWLIINPWSRVRGLLKTRKPRPPRIQSDTPHHLKIFQQITELMREDQLRAAPGDQARSKLCELYFLCPQQLVLDLVFLKLLRIQGSCSLYVDDKWWCNFDDVKLTNKTQVRSYFVTIF